MRGVDAILGVDALPQLGSITVAQGGAVQFGIDTRQAAGYTAQSDVIPRLKAPTDAQRQ